MKKLLAILSLVLLLCLSFCSQQQENEVKKIIEDGVEVVVNHLEPYEIKGEMTISFLNLMEMENMSNHLVVPDKDQVKWDPFSILE